MLSVKHTLVLHCEMRDTMSKGKQLHYRTKLSFRHHQQLLRVLPNCNPTMARLQYERGCVMPRTARLSWANFVNTSFARRGAAVGPDKAAFYNEFNTTLPMHDWNEAS